MVASKIREQLTEFWSNKTCTKIIQKTFHRLKQPLPKITFLDGFPVIPGLVGSLPGAGGCLPKQTPMVNQNSPSFFQNFLRLFPGAQDYLTSLIKTPEVDFMSLSGKYQWVSYSAYIHHCSVHLNNDIVNQISD